jgi:hypothetical protein
VIRARIVLSGAIDAGNPGDTEMPGYLYFPEAPRENDWITDGKGINMRATYKVHKVMWDGLGEVRDQLVVYVTKAQQQVKH